MNLGDLEFKAEDFYGSTGMLHAPDAANEANRLLRERLAKTIQINLWAGTSHARTDLPLVVKALEKTMEALKFYSEMRFNRDKMEWMPGNPDKATNVLAEIEALLRDDHE